LYMGTATDNGATAMLNLVESLKYSWVPSTFSGQGAATPYDSNLVK
uniref:Endo-1,4-beta-xylanase Xyn10A (Fragments) n=1 Tax=Gloeophyllum trabeum TaxID=104355 RepID=XYNA_GLOTR|nr:RecName: Full=Endo-1,4-beta-xylanase Xyn10A [Gloeophyllum trabeum]